MNKLYEKDETLFSVVWILIYLIGMMVGDSLSRKIGIDSSFTVIFNITLSEVLFFWIKKNSFLEKYGLCKAKVSTRSMLFYVPLIIIVTVNFWKGFGINLPAIDTICYVVSMLCVGFIEEVLFRGFLFKGLSKKNVTSAVIISSLTFAIGHMAHLFDGSGVTLVVNLCQVFGAISLGFVWVAIFLRSGSLIPCIITHCAIDVFSAFSNEVAFTNEFRIIISIVKFVILVPYGVYLLKKAKQEAEYNHKSDTVSE